MCPYTSELYPSQFIPISLFILSLGEVFTSMAPKNIFLVQFSLLTTILHTWLRSKYMSWCSKFQFKTVYLKLNPSFSLYARNVGIIFNLSLSLTSYSDHKVLAVFLSRIFLISLFLSISTTTGIVVKNLPASAGDVRDAGSILGLGRPSRVGNGNLLQHSCLENSMEEEPGGL